MLFRSNTGHLLTKTKCWLRAIEGTAALGFLAGIIFATLLLISPKASTEKTTESLTTTHKSVLKCEK